MERVTHQTAALDDGAPLLLVVVRDRLVIVGDPRVIPVERLTDATARIRRWMEDSALTARHTAELLRPQVEQLIKGGDLDLPLAPGRTTS
ncbi:hypothetical protein ACFVZ3_22135 [Kitasatospora purpeofusca]|uniref:hypothetical protein n=1 Tax=Kitasatospora purpeofusca TaxID=67352 RepID=UPI0036845DE9